MINEKELVEKLTKKILNNEKFQEELKKIIFEKIKEDLEEIDS